MNHFWICLLPWTVCAYAGIEGFREETCASLSAKEARTILGPEYDEAVKDLKVWAFTELAWDDQEHLPRLRLESNAINEKYGPRALPKVLALTILLKIGEPEIVKEVSRRFAEFERDPGLRYYPTRASNGTQTSGLDEHYVRWDAVFNSGNPDLLNPLCVKLLKANPRDPVQRRVDLNGSPRICDTPSLTSARYTASVLATAEGIPPHIRAWGEGFRKYFDFDSRKRGDESPLVSVICTMRAFAEANQSAIINRRFSELVMPTEEQVERVRLDPESEVPRVDLSPPMAALTTSDNTNKFQDPVVAKVREQSATFNWFGFIGAALAATAGAALWMIGKRKKVKR